MAEKNRVFFIMKLVAVFMLGLVLTILAYQARLHDKPLKKSERFRMPDLSRVKMDAQARPKIENFKFQNTNYDWVQLADFLGQVVYINFWAEWCEPCLKELPLIEQIYQSSPKAFKYILINVDSTPETQKKAMAFQKQHAPSAYTLYGNTNSLIEMLNVDALPAHILVDKQGRTAAAFVGALGNDMNPLTELLQYLQSEAGAHSP